MSADMRRLSALYSFTKENYLDRKVMSGELSASKRNAFDVHHTRGKLGTLRLDIRFWKLTDREKHNWIGNNPNQARRIGLLCQKGEWCKAPDDDVTRELEVIIITARTSMKEAKQRILKLFFNSTEQ